MKENYHALEFVKPPFIKPVTKTLQMRALFDPELDEIIKKYEEKMQL